MIPYIDYRVFADEGNFELDVLYKAAVASVADMPPDMVACVEHPGLTVREAAAAYNAAMFAARQIAGALLDEARDAGVTEEQYERLSKIAERVAHD
jgi:hypothetical protein